MNQKWLIMISMVIVLAGALSANGDIAKKYNEIEVENSEFMTLQEFDEWLKINDHYDAFVKSYNSSPNHPTVKKMKCLYELENLQSVESEMSYDEMQEKCSSKQD